MEIEFTQQLSDLLMDAEGVRSVAAYELVGVLSTNAGLVVRMKDGAEYQVTVVQSRAADKPDPAPVRTNADGSAVCRHRDVSVCPTCAADERYVEVEGAHFWTPDPEERADLLDLLSEGTR